MDLDVSLGRGPTNHCRLTSERPGLLSWPIEMLVASIHVHLFFFYIYKVNVQDADDSSTIYTHLSREMLWHECISPKSYITQHKELE